jgi:hypothetical protein
MMMIHPAHALLLAKQLHHDLAARAEVWRAGRAAAAGDCLIPVAPAAGTQPCRADPRSPARPAGRHGARLYLHS